MGKELAFPNRPECPPHDWTSIYDEVEGFDEEVIVGKICLKCSLIETKGSLALLESRGKGKGFLRLIARPTLG